MPDITYVSRPLTGATGDRDFTQTLIDETVASAFDRVRVLEDSGFVAKKSLGPGQASHDFELIGKTPETGEYHVIGSNTVGGNIGSGKVNIAVDDIFYKQIDLPLQDRSLSIWDRASKNFTECARIVGERFEGVSMVSLARAARTAALNVTVNGVTVPVHDGGNSVAVINAGGVTAAFPVTSAGADAFELALANLAFQMDEDKLPNGESNRVIYVNNYIRQVLQFSNRMTSTQVRGSIANIGNRNILGQLQGFTIMGTSMFFPKTDINVANNPTELPKYRLNCSASAAQGGGNTGIGQLAAAGEPVALAMVKAPMGSAIAMVDREGAINDHWIDKDSMNTEKVRVARFAGVGVWCPWLAGEVRVAAS